MEALTVFAIAVALAMDCFAVSLSAGTVTKKRRRFTALIISVFFGSFQALMALSGWAAGTWIAGVIGFFDHWIAFSILAVIGGKMVIEGFSAEEAPERDYLSISILLVLSVATSIDALGVGLSLALLSANIAGAAVIIGIVSFLFSFAGVMLGSRLAARFGQTVEVAGGIVLLIIGFRILFEHLGF